MHVMQNSSSLKKLEKLYQTRYISHSDLEDFKAKHHLKSPAKSEIIKQRAKLLATLNFAKLKTFNRTTAKLYHLLNHRAKLNQKFIKREQVKTYQIEGNDLDPQQIAAVVACEDAELILAPAGSGKTASLLAKLNYLTDRLQIPAKNILVIAFTNKVVAELKDRVEQKDIEIRTFHSLGNRILKQKLKNHRLITDAQTEIFFHQTIQALLKNPTYAKNYHRYLNPKKSTFTLPDDATTPEKLEALFISIFNLQKSDCTSLSELKSRLQNLPDPKTRQAALRFFRLYAPVAQKYQAHLEQNHLYDFSDMLTLATDFVRQMPKATLPYQYILVDETQDLSPSKCELLKAVLDNCEKVKLFAVGDDWQSIYRFAGSNLQVLSDFEKTFARATYRGLIELTYRFGPPTTKISNRFIQKNPHQSRKKVVSHVNRRTYLEVRLNSAHQPKRTPPDYAALDQIIQELYQTHGDDLFAKTIQIISRYNHDLYRVVDQDAGQYQNARLVKYSSGQADLSWRIPGARRRLKLSFCTMHKAKGITRDIILVINLNSGSKGMPADRDAHPVTEALLAKLDAYPHAEERRLFYVAITRAKFRTFLIANPKHISPFVFEASPKLKGAGVKVCPKCHRGIMIEKHHKKDSRTYRACSHCHYVKT